MPLLPGLAEPAVGLGHRCRRRARCDARRAGSPASPWRATTVARAGSGGPRAATAARAGGEMSTSTRRPSGQPADVLVHHAQIEPRGPGAAGGRGAHRRHPGGSRGERATGKGVRSPLHLGAVSPAPPVRQEQPTPPERASPSSARSLRLVTRTGHRAADARPRSAGRARAARTRPRCHPRRRERCRRRRGRLTTARRAAAARRRLDHRRQRNARRATARAGGSCANRSGW